MSFTDYAGQSTNMDTEAFYPGIELSAEHNRALSQLEAAKLALNGENPHPEEYPDNLNGIIMDIINAVSFA